MSYTICHIKKAAQTANIPLRIFGFSRLIKRGQAIQRDNSQSERLP